MKKYLICFAAMIVASCSSTKTSTPTDQLYEVLTQQSTGGATIRFYEILTEAKEIAMLQGDETIKQKISDADVQKSTFVILNMGEKLTGGYMIAIDKVDETADKIIVTLKDINPEPGAMVTQAITYPYTVLKINSRKEIELK